jgi:hypothetical protein
MHLVARKFLNNDTEVAEFYEPVPGRILFSAAGSPLGASVLHFDQMQGKTASERWALIAPGELVPEALAQAIERSNDPALANQAPQSAPPEPAQHGDFGAPAPAAESKGDTLLSVGYCASQFWTDWGNWGSGAQARNASSYTYGYYDWYYDGWTGTAGYAACPQGNASGLGGRLSVNEPGSTSPAVWILPPNYYRAYDWPALVNCGWDISCGTWSTVGGTRCSPIAFNINGRFDSQCLLSYGSSCGDWFDWISFASQGSSYCQN